MLTNEENIERLRKLVKLGDTGAFNQLVIECSRRSDLNDLIYAYERNPHFPSTLFDKLGQANYISPVHKALEEAARRFSLIATMPELIQCGTRVPIEHNFWKYYWLTGLSELNLGKSLQGNEVAIIAHLGILSVPDRLSRVYNEGSDTWVNGAVKYTRKEFHKLLEGKLPNGSDIPVFSFTEFDQATELPRRYAVILDPKKIKYHYYGNSIDIAAAGGRSQLIDYVNHTVCFKRDDATLIESKRSKITDFDVPHGRLLILSGDYIGFDDDINGGSRFFVV